MLDHMRRLEDTFIFVNGLEFGAVYTSMLPVIFEEVGPKRVILLSSSPDVNVMRKGPNQLELDVPNGWFYKGAVIFSPKIFRLINLKRMKP